MKQILKLTALTVSVLGPLAAQAHGDEERAKPHVYDASQVEDTDFGREGNPAKVNRTLHVSMADSMRFTPDQVTLRRGQTVRFVIQNQGQALHELVLGTPAALKAHAELMKRFPNMEHSDPNMAHVKPGQHGEIVWQFTRPGEFQFACLQPGHYEAGMTGKVVVK